MGWTVDFSGKADNPCRKCSVNSQKGRFGDGNENFACSSNAKSETGSAKSDVLGEKSRSEVC